MSQGRGLTCQGGKIDEVGESTEIKLVRPHSKFDLERFGRGNSGTHVGDELPCAGGGTKLEQTPGMGVTAQTSHRETK